MMRRKLTIRKFILIILVLFSTIHYSQVGEETNLTDLKNMLTASQAINQAVPPSKLIPVAVVSSPQ